MASASHLQVEQVEQVEKVEKVNPTLAATPTLRLLPSQQAAVLWMLKPVGKQAPWVMV